MKRDVKVFDESRVEMEVSLWGETAEKINAQAGDIIVIKNARVGEYRERKQINVGFGS